MPAIAAICLTASAREPWIPARLTSTAMASRVESWKVNIKCRAFLKGHFRRLGMNGLDGPQLREPRRVQYFVELVVRKTSPIEPVSVQWFVVWEAELH
jgi:hypothetical protein